MNVPSTISTTAPASRRVTRFAGLALAAVFASFGAVGVAHAGVSPDNANCSGTRTCITGKNSGSGVGVRGISTNAGDGVYGSSANGYGILGVSPNGYGVYGSSTGGYGVLAASSSGYGLYAESSGLPAMASYNGNGNATDVTGSYIGLLGRSNNFPLVLTDTSGNDLVFADGVGNLFVHGTLNTFLRTKLGQTATAFGAKTTAATLEHVGSARLVNGEALVKLDPAFAQSIDATTPYHVFVTPGGDSRGLFVTAKSPTSFIVRESQGGRSNFDIDYRIVATTLGHTGDRSTFIDPAKASPHAQIVARPKLR